MADSFSIDKSFFVGFENRKKNFYQNYKNFTNDIEDPIYTGFTLEIDVLHSPLFNKAIDYDTNTSGISSKIQTAITSYYSSLSEKYTETNINTNSFSSGKKIGYGTQTSMYSDSFDYPAIFYVYMADKCLEETTSGGSTFENTDENLSLNPNKDKTNTQSVNGQIKVTAGEVAVSMNPTDAKGKASAESASDVAEDIDESVKNANKIAKEKANYVAKNKEYIDTQIDKLNNYTDAVNTTRKAVEDEISKLNHNQKVLDEAQEAYSNAVKAIDNMTGAKTQLIEYIKYKLGVTKSDNSSKISNIVNQFNTYYNSIDTKQYFKWTISGIDKTTISDDAYKDVKNDLLTNSDISSASGVGKLDNIIVQSNLKDLIIAAYCNINYYKTNLEGEVNTYKTEVSLCKQHLYGTDSEGKIKNESNAVSGSYYGNYKTAKSMLDSAKESKEITDLAKISDDVVKAVKNADNSEKLTKTVSDAVKKEEQSGELKNITPSDIVSVAGESNTEEYNAPAPYKAPQSVIDLIGFVSGMKKITENYPYIFQSVSGLDDAYKNYFKMTESYQGSGENKITISCYESLDLKVSSTFNKYLNAAYDREHKRERIPVNLRRFNCSIYVHDIRNFRYALSKWKKIGGTSTSSFIQLAINHLSVIEFKFLDCEIAPEDTGSVFETVQNTELGEQRMTNFSFTYGNCMINFLPFEDLINNYNSKSNDTLEGETTKDLGDVNKDDTLEMEITKDLGDVDDDDAQEYHSNKEYKTIDTGGETISEEKEYTYLGNITLNDSEEISKHLNNKTYYDNYVNSGLNEYGVSFDDDLGNAKYMNVTVPPNFKTQTLDTGGNDLDGGYYLGNVQYDDYDEYVNLINHSKAIYETIDTGGESMFNGEYSYLGNVRYDDKYEQINLESHTDIRTAANDEENRMRAENSAYDSYMNYGTYNSDFLSRRITEALSASTGYTRKMWENALGLDNEEIDTDGILRKEGNVNNDDNQELKAKFTDGDSNPKKYGEMYSTTVIENNKSKEYWSRLGDEDNASSYHGTIYNEEITNYGYEYTKNNESSELGNVNNDDVQEHNNFIKNVDNDSYLETTAENLVIDENDMSSVFDAVDNTLFGTSTINGINDGTSTVYSTSSTDYVKSEETDQIGSIVENVNIDESSILNNSTQKVDSTTTELKEIYAIKDVADAIGISNSIGNAYNLKSEKLNIAEEIGQINVEDSMGDEVTEIDKQDKTTESLSETKSIGTLSYNISNGKEYTVEESIYETDNNRYSETSSIGKIISNKVSVNDQDSLGSISEEVEKLEDLSYIDTSITEIKKGREYESTNIYGVDNNNYNELKEIGKILTNNVRESSISDLGSNFDKNELPKTEYESEKNTIEDDTKYNETEKIGNIITGEEFNSSALTDLNDIQLT